MTTPSLLSTLAAIVVLLGASDPAWSPPDEDEAPPAAAITAKEIQDHVDYLASDDLNGRRSGTPDCDKAAEYIAKHFEEAGLEPAGDNGTWFQEFQVPVGTELGEGNRLACEGEENPGKLEEDYIPLGFSASGKVKAPVVFAGYGITSETPPYDDYAGLDVKEKIVLVLRYEPRNGDSPFLKGHAVVLSDLRFKAIAARNQGAAGFILVNGPRSQEGEEKGLISLSGSGASDVGIPAVHVTRAWLKTVLDRAGVDLLGVQKEIDEKLEPRSFPLEGVEVDLQVDLQRPARATLNVLGRIEGSDEKLKDEAILFGAHYDHLGIGGEGSHAPDAYGQVHNGADDNASGTAGVIELAEAFALSEERPRRTLLFAAFSGEEEGLLGSNHYVRNPTFPVEKTILMVNFDMIGRSTERKVTVEGTKSGEGLEELLQEANKEIGLDLGYTKAGFGGSDHISFIRKDIPVLFFFTGTHTDYHKPSDDSDKIEAQSEEEIVRLAYAAARILDSRDEGPKFIEPPPPKAPPEGARAGRRAWLGTEPDMAASDVEGVRISDVTDGSPADKAEMKGGDVLVRIGDKPIRDLYDFTYALRTYKPGDEVEIEVLRGEEKVVLKATLSSRGQK